MKLESSSSLSQVNRLLPSDAGISALCYLPGNEWFSMSAVEGKMSRLSTPKDTLSRRRKEAHGDNVRPKSSMGCRTAGGLHTKASEVWRNTRGSQFHAPLRDSLQENRMRSFDYQGQVELLRRQIADLSAREKKLKEKHDNLYIKYSQVCLENRMLTEQVFELEEFVKDKLEVIELEKVISGMRDKIEQLEENQDHWGIKEYYEIESRLAEGFRRSMETVSCLENALTTLVANQSSMVSSSHKESEMLCQVFQKMSSLEHVLRGITITSSSRQLESRRELDALSESNKHLQEIVKEYRRADESFGDEITKIANLDKSLQHLLSEIPICFAQRVDDNVKNERKALRSSLQELQELLVKEREEKEELQRANRAQRERYCEKEGMLKEMETAIKRLELDLSLKDQFCKKLEQDYQQVQSKAESKSRDQEELEKKCGEYQERIEDMEETIQVLSSKKSKVAVVTPKIFISLPDSQPQDQGSIALPNSVLKKLVAAELGYTPEVSWSGG
mmetsp:Transcript_41751/g.131630  ORF Transcript_41751/g.131630 Transcript_41751/m.131630 type:complete len:504 (-) Transcript_41751:256-1767(-)